MIYQRKVPHPWHFGVMLIEHVCTCCGHIHQGRPKNGKCSSCKR
jgi:rubrerythrin